MGLEILKTAFKAAQPFAGTARYRGALHGVPGNADRTVNEITVDGFVWKHA